MAPPRPPPLLPLLLISLFLLPLLTTSLPSHQTLALLPLIATATTSLTIDEGTTSFSDQVRPSNNSFHVNLHHRDSFPSNSTTSQQLLQLRLDRDAARVFSLHQLLAASSPPPKPNTTRKSPRPGFSSSVTSGLSQGSGEYFARIAIGTPPTPSLVVLDTGSDVVWIQCQPCRRCYSQSFPFFNPSKSSSFSPIPCSSPLCRRLDVSGCNPRRNSCLYQVSYGDGSVTTGDFSLETLTFSNSVRIPNIALGCGHDNQGLFVAAAGLLGLGRGGLSFPSQAGKWFGNKFSYCLVDRTSSPNPNPKQTTPSSTLVFGASAVPKSRPVAFTPMLRNPKLDTFYYVELTGVSVGGSRVTGIQSSDLKLDTVTGRGGVIVDSGTSVTRLARPAYVAMRDAFKAGAVDLKEAVGGFSLFDTCYDLTGKNEVKVPTVVMHFGGGADVSLPAENYLIPVDTTGTFCFAFAGTDSGVSIIGNIQQQGLRVVFDEAANRVGFAPRGC